MAVSGGRVCTWPRGRYGHTRVDVSGVRAFGRFGPIRVCTTMRTFLDVRACDGCVDVSDVCACAPLRGRFG